MGTRAEMLLTMRPFFLLLSLVVFLVGAVVGKTLPDLYEASIAELQVIQCYSIRNESLSLIYRQVLMPETLPVSTSSRYVHRF